MSSDGSELTFPHAETYPAPGLLLKTLDAIAYLDRRGIRFDYLLRTNLSSLFDWWALNDRLRRLGRRTGYVAGVAYAEQRMSGMCLLLTWDLVRHIVDRRQDLDEGAPDDVAIAPGNHR